MSTTIQSILESYNDNVVALALHLELIPYYAPEHAFFPLLSGDQQEQDDYIEGLDDARKLIDDGDYLSLTDDEADYEEDKRLDDYIDECILPELDERYAGYFDGSSWKSDARQDGRGHTISSYDGEENEQVYNGITYFIYRIN